MAHMKFWSGPSFPISGTKLPHYICSSVHNMKETNSSQTLMLILRTTWHQISKNHKHVLKNDYTKADKTGFLELLQEFWIMELGHPILLSKYYTISY
jgi:hypothetical protein